MHTLSCKHQGRLPSSLPLVPSALPHPPKHPAEPLSAEPLSTPCRPPPPSLPPSCTTYMHAELREAPLRNHRLLHHAPTLV